MTLSIDLTPMEETALLYAAGQRGIAPAELVKRLMLEHLPVPNSAVPDRENQGLINLLRSWREEDATDDLEELTKRDQETSEFLKNLQENRFNLPGSK